MIRQADVAILGGGPSGTAAGLALLQRGDLNIALVEASRYDTPRIGESLTPGARPLLEYFGLWQEFQAEQSLEAFGSRAAWGSETMGTHDYFFTVQGNGWSLDRMALDRLFAETFRERGGSLLLATRCLGGERTDEGWVLTLRQEDGGLDQLHCRYVIDASGRRSPWARRQGIARVAHDQLAAAACFGRLPEGRTIDACVEVEACEKGWWYTSPTPGGGVVAAFLTDVDLLRDTKAARPDQWRELASALPRVQERLYGAEFPNPPRVFSAASTRLLQVGGPGWVAVGDAAASHDPLSSSGIPHALGSGIQGAVVAADALSADGQALAAYGEAIQEDFLHYLQTRRGYYQRENRWPDAPFWKRRRTSVLCDPEAKIAFRDQPSQVRDSIHIPSRVARRLLKECEPGVLVHQVVRSVVDRHPDIAHQRIILGLQSWVDQGVVHLSDRASP